MNLRARIEKIKGEVKTLKARKESGLVPVELVDMDLIYWEAECYEAREAGLTLPKKPKGKTVWLTPEEAQKQSLNFLHKECKQWDDEHKKAV